MLPALSPAIDVLTQRPRYYSFYAFLLDEFIRRGRPAPAELPGWRSMGRASSSFRLALICVGTRPHRPEHDRGRYAVGTNKTSGLAARELPAYDTQTDYIDSDLGGYGLYYRTVMAELGLIYLGGPGYLTPSTSSPKSARR